MSSFSPPDWPYLELRAALYDRDGEHACHGLRLEDAARWWACSPRTARRQLVRLHAQGRLSYAPGRGRGNTSRVAFATGLKADLEDLTEQLAAQGAAGDLARLSRLPFPRAWVLTDAARDVFGLSATPAGADRLRTVLTRDLTSLDPLHASATAEAHLLAQVLDPLTRFDTESGALQPHLAHHWGVSADGLCWTFHLRKAVAFHHGRTLDARDVQFTLERLRDGAPWFLPDLLRAEAAGPSTVRLHLARPDAFLPRRLADTQALILPRDVPFDEGQPVGTGAFRWTPLNGGFRLTAFDAHFAGRPLIDEVEVYRVGGADHGNVRHYQVEGAAPATVDGWQAEVGVQFLIWNAARPAARNAALRAAIGELHDVSAFWRETERRDPLVPATSFFPRRSAQQPPRLRSGARAAALLREAAYTGPPLRLWVLDLPDPLAEGEWLVARAAQHGLQLDLHPYPLTATPASGDAADLVLLGEVAGADEHLSFWTALRQPELLFRRLLPTEVLAGVDGALDAYRTARTFAEYEAVLDRVERLLVSGHHVNLTHHRVKRRNVHPLIRDVAPDAYGRINLKRLWVGERQEA
ncbi:oligopeptide transport periplasmic protein [Deinococcus phoenicis]|uniref:Oligopeptide transport periplasmic protein n=1 Tax=Deinococcus phoenicis TaxID=1476583 RepID=A0A016QRU7_9DEIO|nr:ABC transporter substrate-binding protein [Deinococcus phoenicis]EYB68592.1 oligopeptide transport periplasmic protein [Deinococcus phoenicis]